MPGPHDDAWPQDLYQSPSAVKAVKSLGHPLSSRCMLRLEQGLGAHAAHAVPSQVELGKPVTCCFSFCCHD